MAKMLSLWASCFGLRRPLEGWREPKQLAVMPVQEKFEERPEMSQCKGAIGLPKMSKIAIDGQKVPQFAFGMGTYWSKRGDPVLSRTLIETLKTAMRIGYTHMDCSDNYNTEPELGVAIKEIIAEGTLKRDNIFVTTKCMNMVNDLRTALENSLKALDLKYVDLYLIHTPFKYESQEELIRAWAQMEQIRHEGLAKSIGVSNFRLQDLKTIVGNCKVRPAVNQIEYHPYLQHVELRKYMEKTGIALEGYGPLVSLRGDDYLRDGPIDAYVKELAHRYNVTEDNVLLRWQIQQDIVMVTTSSKEERLRNYLHSIDGFQLTQAELEEISQLGSKKHFRAYMVGPGRFDPDDGL